MKAPIQELIEFAEGLWATNPNPRIYHSSIIGKAKSLLDKDKEVIMNAYIEGCFDHILDESTDKQRAEDYYNETFKIK